MFSAKSNLAWHNREQTTLNKFLSTVHEHKKVFVNSEIKEIV